MTEEQAKESIKDIPVGGKIQVIKTNGDIVEVVLASHDTASIPKKEYANGVVPEMPPAIIVQGKRWGVFRLEVEDLIKIARIA